MEKKSDNLHSDEWLKNLPLRSESEGYKSEEMIVCKKCQRNNPPTRLDCMYCGAKLEFDQTQSQLLKPVLRKIEPYAKGFNLIYLANLAKWDEKQLSEVAKMTRIERNDLQKLVESTKSLPIARAETLQETEIVSQRLDELGIKTTIIEDDAFELEQNSRRLRRIDFYEDKIVLILFNNDEIFEIERDKLALIVVGAIFERKLETTEKYKKKGENKVLEIAEVSSDEILIDIYTKDDLISYRITQKGFDFSSLGSEKNILAVENMKLMVAKLRSFAPNALFDDSYLKVRDDLSHVWEVEELNETKGMQRRGFGTFNRLSEIKTSNLLQFTKYSRLQFHLLQSGD